MFRHCTYKSQYFFIALTVFLSVNVQAEDEQIRSGSIHASVTRQGDGTIVVGDVDTDLPDELHAVIRNWMMKQDIKQFFMDGKNAATLSVNAAYDVFEHDDASQSLAFRLEGANAVSKPSLQQLFADAKFMDVEISPNGKYLAVKMPVDGKERLVVLGRDKLDLQGNMMLQGQEVVADVYWIKDDRLLFTNAVRLGWQDQPVWYGEIFAASANGKSFIPVFGYRTGNANDQKRAGTRLKTAAPSRAWGRFITDIRDDEHHVLIASYPWNVRHFSEAIPTVYRLNILNGTLTEVASGPAKGASFVADVNGKLRYAVSVDSDWAIHIHEFISDSGTWKKTASAAAQEGYTWPAAVSADGTKVFHISNAGVDTQGLYELRLENGESRLLFRDDKHDISRVYFDPYTREPLWVVVDAERSEVVYVDAEHRLSKLHRGLLQAFPGKRVAFTSATRDYREVIAFVHSDIDPGAYYSIDTETLQAEFLVPYKTDLKPAQLVEMQPVSFKARDGVSLEGFYTPAQGVDGLAPLVVLVHGGPHARDTWHFDPMVQMLATRGYGVLQVNFRGSTGRGRYFEGAGYGQWGRIMQDDVTDATRWAIKEKLADPERTCIVGGSYGGYATMMGLVREPDLYRCGVSMYGVSDIELLFTEGDIPDALWGKSYMRATLGEDKAEWAARSPSRLADQIQAPVLLVHGGKDERAPISHARKMEAALKSAGKPVETFYVDTESHGFMNEANRVRAHEIVLEFLDRHIGHAGE